MEYVTLDQVQGSLSDGDIVFVKGKWTSVNQALIMLVTRSTLTHCAITFKATIGGKHYQMVVEAQGGTKRRILSLDYYKNRKLVIAPAPKNWLDVRDVALSKVGISQYGWIQALYVGIRDMMLRYFDIKLPSKNLPAEICSEFIARVYDIKDPNVSPQGLYDQLKEA